MSSVLLNILELNERINYGAIALLMLLYIVIFWLIVSIWVFKDVSKRYEGKWKAYVFFIGNLLLGFPFLILYILIRPSDEELLDNYEYNQGGINVPIVNFTGKDGVNISFNLRIDTNKFNTQKNEEMKIGISFDSNDKNKQVIKKEEYNNKEKEINVEAKEDKKISAESRLMKFLKKIQKVKVFEEDVVKPVAISEDSGTNEIKNNKNSKSKKKNKNKSKSKNKGNKKK